MRPNHVNCVGNVNKALYFFSTNISVPKGSSVSQKDLTFHDLRHEVQGVRAVIISERSQTADPVFFEMFGEGIASAHTVIVKSRGHFRAGFKTWFDDDQTYEIDTVGLTSPVLSRWDFENVPRPSFPFQHDVVWSLGLSTKPLP